MKAHQTQPIHTFTCSFSEASFDESKPASAVAKCFGTDHHSPRLAADHLDGLLRVIDHAEDPIADNSLLSVWALCQSTAPHVTVALSGDGADELLAGYSTYRATSLSNFFSRIPRPIRQRILKLLLRSIPATETKYSASMLAERFLIGADRTWPINHCSWRTMIDAEVSVRVQWRLHGRSGKLVLRAAMRHRLPSDILSRKKAGFVIPIESWLRGAWRDLLRRVLNEDFCEETQILSWPGVRSLLDQHSSGQRNHAYALFTLLVFALWWRRWIQPNHLTIQFPRQTFSRPTFPTRVHRLPILHEGNDGK